MNCQNMSEFILHEGMSGSHFGDVRVTDVPQSCEKKIRPFNNADSLKCPGSETNTSRKFNPNVPQNYHHSAKSHEY